MAKQKAKRPEIKSVTLATGTKVVGPVAAVDKMVARARRDASKTSSPAPSEQATSTEPPEGTPLTGEEQARAATNAAGSESNSTPATAPERPSRGASLAAWTEFAKATGFEHDEKASRDEIRDAYEAAHPAE